MMSRAVSGLTTGRAAEAVQYSDEATKPQESFIVGDVDGGGAGAAARWATSVKGSCDHHVGICRSRAAAAHRPLSYHSHANCGTLQSISRKSELERAVHLLVLRLYSSSNSAHSCRLTSPTTYRRPALSPAPGFMLKAQVLRRNFSLFNRVPYSRIVRSAARDGHESVIIQRVRIQRPFFSKS